MHATARTVVITAMALTILPYAVLYAVCAPSHLWLPDDAFYYFEIARNIAEGRGSTFDGLHPTNGYHPLWQLILAGLALAVESRHGFVAAAILLQCLLVWLGWTIAFRLLFDQATSRNLFCSVMIACALTWNYYNGKALINGLESALFFAAATILLKAFGDVYFAPAGRSIRKAVVFGCTAAVLILSRLDGVFLVAGLLVAWLVYSASTLQSRPSRMIIAAAIPAVALAVYMLVNQLAFGLWMPVSGYIKRMVRPPGPSTVTVTAYLVFALVVAAAVRMALGRWPRRASGRTELAVTALSGAMLVYQADAWLVRGALVPEIWYLAQHVLWAFMIGSLIFHRLLESPTARPRRFATTAVVLAAAVGIGATWAVRLQASSLDHYVAMREGADWMNAHLPKDAIIGSWDCGMLGYYSDATVVNLDGLVNSAYYLRFLRENRVLDFLDTVGVQYVAQYYKASFERTGLDVEEFRRRAGEVLWSREIRFASMRTFLRTGVRRIEVYPFEVRRYRRA